MTDDTGENAGSIGAGLMRLATLTLGGIQIILFSLFAHVLLQSTDPLGASIGEAMTLVMSLPVLAMTLPGVLLAWLDRAPRVALALVVLAFPVGAALWHFA